MTDGGQMQVDDVLERAAKLLEEPGMWTQGVSATEDVTLDGRMVAGVWIPQVLKSFCMVGAIRLIAAGDPYTDNDLAFAACRATNDAMGERVYDSVFSNIIKWNDAEGREVGEVTQALRDAATHWRSAQV